MKKILVSIVNYCDPEFYNTVKNLWDSALNKDFLIFSLVSEDQNFYNFDFIPKDQIIYKHFDINVYRGGVAWARNLAINVDFQYDYLMQFDSHTYSSLGWDVNALNTYNKINDNKFLISYCPANYEINDDGSIDYNIHPTISMMAKRYDLFAPGFGFPEYHMLKDQEISEGYWVTCCYLFAPYEWVKDVGIDEKSSFNTEEFNLSLRTYSKSWKIFGFGCRDTFHHMSHKQTSGLITRQSLRPWADGRRDEYWSHVETQTNFTSRLMSGLEDVPIEKVKEFFDLTGMDKKYMNLNENYYSYIEIENRGYGMPPRR